MDAISQAALGIGQWTSTQKHALGFIWKEPAKFGVHGARTYMYVKFTLGSGAAGYDGSLVGFLATSTDALFNVAADISAVVPINTPCGVIRNTTGAAVTTNYYGWIQLIQPYEILKSVILSSDIGANSLAQWAVDSYGDLLGAYVSTHEGVILPFGVVLTGDPDGATALISTQGYWDVLPVLNPYRT